MMNRPSELKVQDIYAMDRDNLISGLLEFNDFCFFQFSPESLGRLANSRLRQLLLAARNQYQAQGY